ncbi:MAG TPA: hypothetical protein VII97_03145 [Anaerolineales bacterium]
MPASKHLPTDDIALLPRKNVGTMPPNRACEEIAHLHCTKRTPSRCLPGSAVQVSAKEAGSQ